MNIKITQANFFSNEKIPSVFTKTLVCPPRFPVSVRENLGNIFHPGYFLRYYGIPV